MNRSIYVNFTTSLSKRQFYYESFMQIGNNVSYLNNDNFTAANTILPGMSMQVFLTWYLQDSVLKINMTTSGPFVSSSVNS